MREKQFVEAMNKMTPTLYRKFHYWAKEANVKQDRKTLVEDLVQLTILEAFQNSQRDRHLIISCEQLLRIKAKNVWADFWKKSMNKAIYEQYDEIRMEQLEKLSPDDKDLVYSKIDFLFEIADKKSADIIQKRLDGYSVTEIASMYDTTAAAITMHIQRLKKKIHGSP